MKIDPNAPAFPVQESMVSGSTGEVPAASGLTIRAHFAAMAMQGILLNPDVDTPRYVAAEAVRHADALIAALNSEVK